MMLARGLLIALAASMMLSAGCVVTTPGAMFDHTKAPSQVETQPAKDEPVSKSTYVAPAKPADPAPKSVEAVKDQTSQRKAPLPVAFSRPMRVSADGIATTSPTLALAPTGELYLLASTTETRSAGPLLNQNHKGVTASRSSDGGNTWTPLTIPTEFMTGASRATLAVGPDGVVYLAGVTADPTGMISNQLCVVVATSADRGESWQPTPLACAGDLGVKNPSIAFAGSTAVLAYEGVIDETTSAILTRTSTDAGKTWTPSTEVGIATPIMGAITADGNGVLYIPHALTDELGRTTGVAVAVSADQGATWQTTTVTRGAETPTSPPTVKADRAGNVFIAFAAAEGDSTAIFLAKTLNKGQNWSAPARVNVVGGSNAMPTLTTGTAGRVALAWYWTSFAGAPGDVDMDAQWFPRVAMADDALTSPLLVSDNQISTLAVHNAAMDTRGPLASGIALATLPDGRIVMAMVSDAGANASGLFFLGQTSGPRLTA